MRIGLSRPLRERPCRGLRPAAAAVLASLAAIAAAGCAAPSLDVLQMDEVAALKAAVRSPMHATLAVAVSADSAKWSASREGDRYACRIKADPAALRRTFASAARRIGLFAEVVEYGQAEPGPADLAGGGVDFLVRLSLSDHSVEYEGRNIWWIPNLVLWAVAWIPSWIIPDEDYSARVEFAASVYHVPSGRLLREFKAAGSIERSLNDFQALWHLWGILLIPFVLDEENYEEIAPAVLPHAVNASVASFLKSMAAFRADVEAGRIEIPRPAIAPKPPPHPGPAPDPKPDPGPKPKPDPAAGAGPGGPSDPAAGGTPGDGRPPRPGPVPRPAPRNLALVIGSMPAGAASDSDLCAADARRFASWLVSTGRFEAADVAVLKGPAATLSAARDALARAASKASEDDSFLLYFAGFGLPQAGEGGPPACVALADTPSGREAAGLGLDELFKALGNIRARGKTVVLDASFGRAARFRSLGSPGDRASVQPDLAAAAGGNGVTALFAADGTGDGAIEMKEAGGGLFTHYFIAGAAGAADSDGDGMVSAAELGSYVRRQASNAASLLGESQSPLHAAGSGSSPALPPKR